jgi:hypothetical protein
MTNRLENFWPGQASTSAHKMIEQGSLWVDCGAKSTCTIDFDVSVNLEQLPVCDSCVKKGRHLLSGSARWVMSPQPPKPVAGGSNPPVPANLRRYKGPRRKPGPFILPQTRIPNPIRSASLRLTATSPDHSKTSAAFKIASRCANPFMSFLVL